MLRFARVFWVLLFFLPAAVRADESCDALGHLLLASDLMLIAANSGADVESTYGPSIGASLRSSADLPRDVQQRRPDRVSALDGLRQIASTALAFVSAGQAESATLGEAGRTVARDGRQLYVDWTCDDPEPGDGTGELTGGEDADRDPSNGGVGDGSGGMTFRAVWIALGNENRTERAVLLGCFVTSMILLPYLLIRDRRKRRRSERFPSTLPTIVSVAEVETEATYFDISITGARLTLPVVLEPGTEIMVEVGGEPVLAHVVRSGKGFAGVEFASTLKAVQLEAHLDATKQANSFAARYGDRSSEAEPDVASERPSATAQSKDTSSSEVA